MAHELGHVTKTNSSFESISFWALTITSLISGFATRRTFTKIKTDDLKTCGVYFLSLFSLLSSTALLAAMSQKNDRFQQKHDPIQKTTF